MTNDTSRALTRVGVVGAGQLALMMGESASDLGLTLSVLANSPEDSATTSIEDVVLGAANDIETRFAVWPSASRSSHSITNSWT